MEKFLTSSSLAFDFKLQSCYKALIFVAEKNRYEHITESVTLKVTENLYSQLTYLFANILKKI
jgi:hypothetical protein